MEAGVAPAEHHAHANTGSQACHSEKTVNPLARTPGVHPLYTAGADAHLLGWQVASPVGCMGHNLPWLPPPGRPQRPPQLMGPVVLYQVERLPQGLPQACAWKGGGHPGSARDTHVAWPRDLPANGI